MGFDSGLNHVASPGEVPRRRENPTNRFAPKDLGVRILSVRIGRAANLAIEEETRNRKGQKGAEGCAKGVVRSVKRRVRG